MISIVANSGKLAYGVNKYILDSEDELETLNCSVGSAAYIKESDKNFIKVGNEPTDWIEKSSSASSGGGSGEGDSALTTEEVLALLV